MPRTMRRCATTFRFEMLPNRPTVPQMDESGPMLHFSNIQQPSRVRFHWALLRFDVAEPASSTSEPSQTLAEATRRWHLLPTNAPNCENPFMHTRCLSVRERTRHRISPAPGPTLARTPRKWPGSSGRMNAARETEHSQALRRRGFPSACDPRVAASWARCGHKPEVGPRSPDGACG